MENTDPQDRHLESPVVYKDILEMKEMFDKLTVANMKLNLLLSDKLEEKEKKIEKIDVNQAHLLTGKSQATIRKRCTVIDRGFANKALYDKEEVIEKFGEKE